MKSLQPNSWGQRSFLGYPDHTDFYLGLSITAPKNFKALLKPASQNSGKALKHLFPLFPLNFSEFIKHQGDQRIKTVLLFLPYFHKVSRNRENIMTLLRARDRQVCV